MNLMKQKLEKLRLEFVKLHMLKNYKNKIEALEVLRILIEEITTIINEEKEDYLFFYKILLDSLELVIKTVQELLLLDDAKNLVEYLEEKEETILWIIYDLLEEDEEREEDFFIERVEKVEKMIDEYNLRKEKRK